MWRRPAGLLALLELPLVRNQERNAIGALRFSANDAGPCVCTGPVSLI
jgi:hypothetical protein